MPSANEPTSVHRIRLRGPWSFLWLRPPSGLPAEHRSGSIRLPSSWPEALGDTIGTVRLSRTFNRPTGLEGARAWLEIDASTETSVSLNGAFLGHFAPGAARFDVTARLELHSRIDLELTRDEPGSERQALAEVALVIESFD